MESLLYEWVVSGEGFLRQLEAARVGWVTTLFHLFTFLGDEEFFLAALPAVYWLASKPLGRRLSYMLVFVFFINTGLKNLFALPRPPADLHLVSEDSYGLPSGHAQGAVALWGYAAYWLRARGPWIWAVTGLMVLGIAFSRLYLGVHWPADTITGLVAGLLVLLLFIRAEPTARAWMERADPRLGLGGLALLSVLLVLALPGDAYGYPAENGATLMGLLLGMLLGFHYEERRVGFQVAGTPLQFVGRYLLGIGLLMLFWLGLRLLFGMVDGGHGVEIALRFIRYACCGLAVAWWAPALFVRFGLAKGNVGRSA
jgi:undecaprenyl-diphosphatase